MDQKQLDLDKIKAESDSEFDTTFKGVSDCINKEIDDLSERFKDVKDPQELNSHTFGYIVHQIADLRTRFILLHKAIYEVNKSVLGLAELSAAQNGINPGNVHRS